MVREGTKACFVGMLLYLEKRIGVETVNLWRMPLLGLCSSALTLLIFGRCAFKAVQKDKGVETPDVLVTQRLSASHGQAEKWEEV